MGGLVGLFALAINEEGQLTVIKTGTVPALSRLAYISTKHVVGLTRELANDIRALSRITSYNVCYTKLLRTGSCYFF